MARSAERNTYLIRQADGAETGPFTAEGLIVRTLSGEVTAETPLRPALLPTWKPAREYSFLFDKLQMPKSIDVKDTGGGVEPAPVTPFTNRIDAGIFEFTPASIRLRLAAGTTDLLLLLPASVGIPLGLEWLYAVGGEPGAETSTASAVGIFAVMLLYWTAAYGFRGQTPGQWYWGLLTVRKDGRQVWLGRAFAAALATLFAGPLMFLFVHVTDSRRSLSDLAAGVRVIRTRVVTTI